MIIIVSHASFKEDRSPIMGTGAFFSPYFKRKKRKYIYIRFPLHGEKYYHVEVLLNKSIKQLIIPYNFSDTLFLRSIQEFIVLRYLFNKIINTRFIISIDPLNTLYSLILSKIKNIKVIFYTADYAKKRFSNFILNMIYHLIDFISINGASFVWNVSTRITAVRKKQGLSMKKNFFIPNSPLFDENRILDYENIDKYSLIAVTTMSNSIDFNSLFSSISFIKNKFPKVHLSVIGRGNWERMFEESLQKFKIEDNVSFYGAMEYYDLLDKIKRSSIGIALYTNDNSWTYYCDSMKARDYLACGLPVVISSISSTSDDIEEYNAGLKISDHFEKNLTDYLIYMFSNEIEYKKQRQNSINLAKKFDIEQILDRTFKKCKIKI